MTSTTRNHHDATGRSALVRNVLSSWGGHTILVVAGFILPRMIDREMGQAALGIWDFCWSLVSYFGITQIGVGASVNSFVARHRTARDVELLNRVVSSAMAVQLVAGMLVFLWTLLSAYFLPTFFPDRFGDLLNETRWVVVLLGSGLAIQIALDSFGNVITGCHRWDIHNAIHAGFYGATVTGMIVSLLLGGGLRSLALASMCGTVLAELTRVVMTYRICPELSLRLRFVSWDTTRGMLAFGGKVVLGGLSLLLIYQTTSVFIVAYLGPGSLALYARAMALVRHCSIFVEKFASILTPTASSLDAMGERSKLQTFLLETAGYSAFMVLPPILFLAILGGPVLQVWMGPQYAQGEVLTVLALGHLMSIANTPLWTILRGIDKHGWPALVRFGAAACVALFAWLMLSRLSPNLMGAALAVTIPLTLFEGIYLPWYATQQFNISTTRYAQRVWGLPLLCVLPFAMTLLGVRAMYLEQPSIALMAGMILGGLVLGVVYWHRVVPLSLRESIWRKLLGSPQSAAQPLHVSKN